MPSPLPNPNAGSDAAALELRATPDGDGWRLNGQKVFTSGASVPNTVIAVAARTDPDAPKHEGISLFLVPNDAPGVQVRELPTLSRGCFGTTEVFFADMRVEPGQLLGELNRGWQYITGHLELERVSIAPSYLGAAHVALEQARAYARQRKQFGRHISEFQAIRHLLARLRTE